MMTGIKIALSLLVLGITDERGKLIPVRLVGSLQEPVVKRGLPGFALVELFTSEGCSSCPAADEAVAKVNKEFGANVYVLGFHVDYWDRLGWKDSYSNKDYTARQRGYASLFNLSSIYTPQVVVNGSSEFVGSDETRLRSAITSGLASKTNIAIALHVFAGTASGGNGAASGGKDAAAGGKNKKLQVSYALQYAAKASLHIALVELRATSHVLAGENRSRTLTHVNIVRGFKTISGSGLFKGLTELDIPADLAEDNYKVIVFLQNDADSAIAGVTEVKPENKP